MKGKNILCSLALIGGGGNASPLFAQASTLDTTVALIQNVRINDDLIYF